MNAKTLATILAVVLVAHKAPALAAEPQATTTARGEAETLGLLLSEVRELRRAVERLAVVSVRVQVTLQRLSLQQQRVRALADQAEQLEAAIAASSADVDRARAELADLQERVEQEADPEARRALAEQRRSLRDVIERQTAQEQEERRRAADVSAQLTVETGKLNDLTQSLDDLERGLDSLVGRPASPARPGGNP